MITIGVDSGGPEPIFIDDILIQAASAAMRARESDFKKLGEGWINPIFIVPGSVSRPDFEGHKLGHFSKKEKGLVVQIAVPQPVADGEGTVEFIGSSLREAVRLAASRFASEGLSFSTLKAEKIILAIEAALSE